MSVHKRVVVECDKRVPNDPDNPFRLHLCSASWEGDVAEPRDVALARAHVAGWSRHEGYDYCPEHTAT